MLEPFAPLLLALHLLFTSAMAGLIWFVQVVHYPMFSNVGDSHFAEYEAIHMRLTTKVVAPIMLPELLATIALLFIGLQDTHQAMAIACVALLVINWVSTACLQVPCHRTLSIGFDYAAHRRLVRTNWIRTSAWTIKSVLAVALIA